MIFLVFKLTVIWIKLGGFGSYLLSLSKKTYEQAGVNTDGNPPWSYKEPGIGWMTAFLFLVCFVGLFVLIPLRKVCLLSTFYINQILSLCFFRLQGLYMYSWFAVFHKQIIIIDYKLTFPSGTATAVLVNGFHNRGDKMAK